MHLMQIHRIRFEQNKQKKEKKDFVIEMDLSFSTINNYFQ